MTIRVPFQLRRRSSGVASPAEALYIPGRDAAAVLSACSRLGLDPSGRVHDLAGGLLVRLAGPTSAPVPGAIRLRELSTDLFVPVDAELVPALLDDEASGLVRDGGLVFLPGGRVLRFERRSPLGLGTLLDAPPGPRRDWQPMPEPRALADRIIEIDREWPEAPPEDVYRELERDLRRRPGRSRPSGGAGGAGGRGYEDEDLAEAVGEGGGRSAGRHGRGKGLRGLFGRAGSRAKSLGETLKWGMRDHSRLVQKLLREFRHGDAEEAIRHALPMAPADPGSGSRMVDMGASLPFSRAIYNLFELLGGGYRRGGTVGVWQARTDLVEELMREYRRAAEEAVRRGDFRRAAYIYGKLLGDHRMAASALQRGGLHHDAAILYLKKVNDKAAAAQAFEAAGMVDRALALYRELGRHESAGDLLRRIGDEAGAREEYLLAATRAGEARPPDWLEAGRILHRKAGLIDRAVAAYRCGWLRQPAANATACALELVAIHAPRGEVEPLRGLLDEADAFYRSMGYVSDAGLFYNRMAVTVAAVPDLSAFAEEVHDRARLALADLLRRKVEAGELGPATVSSVFAEPTLWAPAFVRDAQFAATTAGRRSRSGRPHYGLGDEEKITRPPIIAACQAAQAADIFLASADGQIVAYRPRISQVVPVGKVPGGISAMAADPDGQVVVTLQHNERGATLAVFVRLPDGTFRGGVRLSPSGSAGGWLSPIVSLGAESFVGIGDENAILIIEAASGLTSGRILLTALEQPPSTAFLLPGGDGWRAVTHEGSRWVVLDRGGHCVGRSSSAWRPYGGSRGYRCNVPLSWMYLDGVLRVVGLDEMGAVHASQFFIDGEEADPIDDRREGNTRDTADRPTAAPDRSGEGALELLAAPTASTPGGYVAVTSTGPERVVAISRARAEWLRETPDRFRVVHTVEDPGLAQTVACFPSNVPDEVLVVSSDGRITRLGVSRRPRSRAEMA